MGLLGLQGDANLVTNLFFVPRQKQTLTLLLFARHLTRGLSSHCALSVMMAPWRSGEKSSPFL